MALAEIGARLRLQGAAGFRRDATRAAGATDRLGREVGQLDRESGRAKRALSGLAKGMGGLGRAAGGIALAGAAAGGGIAVLGLSLLDTATQMEALSNKAATVFGAELGGVEKWAKASGEAMGLSATQATGLAAGMADLLIPMGFSRKAAAKMSTDLTGLSGALAQWSGGTRSATEVAEMLQGAIMGDAAALESLGIGIGAADIEARLLAKGQSKLTDAALKQAEAQAIIELTFEKSTDAQKGYADGANKLGIAQAKLSAKVQTLRERFATKLTPFFVEALSWVEARVPSIERKLDKFATTLGDAVKPGSEFRTEMAALWPKIKAVGEFAKSALKKLGDLIGWMREHENVVKTFAAVVLSVKGAMMAVAAYNAVAAFSGIVAGFVGITGAAAAANLAIWGPVGLLAGLAALGAAWSAGEFAKMVRDLTEGAGTPYAVGLNPMQDGSQIVESAPRPGAKPGDKPASAFDPGRLPPVQGVKPYINPKPAASVTSNMTGSGMTINPAPVVIKLNEKVVGEGMVRFMQDSAARR